MIKYLGSKRTLLPLIREMAAASQARTALDLFSGTTRIARAFKGLGIQTIASDSASYSEVFAKTWIELDATEADQGELFAAIERLNRLPGAPGYFTQKFSTEAQFFQAKNAERIDAIREQIELEYRGSWLYFPLLTSLIQAADRVDSTTGQQMAFLKSWSLRSGYELELRDPELLPGTGQSLRGDAVALAANLPAVDLAYLDPPYNQHRYFGNYHIWESLVRWDKPETYGVANKRVDSKSAENRSAFNSRKTMPQALEKVMRETRAKNLILSFNNESWISTDELINIASERGHVKVLDIDFKRYVGSKIGVYNKAGDKVGEPGNSRNVEHLLICGEPDAVERIYLAGMKFK